MKKIILFFIFLTAFTFFYPALADESAYDNSNWGVHPLSDKEQKSKETSSSEKIWNEEQDEMIYENYGSEESPAFLNRENTGTEEYDSDSSGNME